MLLKWIELENIRSYVKERITFPTGSTLLSGDVGCGKSSVLLATEFALFGIQRGELSGTDLLRHGTNEGKIQLCFEVNGKEVVIFRSLKRDKKGVSQEAGWIQIGGVKQSKMASELRAIVLEMLGYPLEYQTKNPIVFRYTVYTPQDEMKRILFGLPDERLSILRKVFQIDKYGRIRSNAESIVIREIRAMKREAESLSADLEQRVAESEKARSQLELLGSDLKNQQTASELLGQELASKSKEVEKITGQIRTLGRLAQSAATRDSLVRERKSRNQRIAVELTDLGKKVSVLEKLLGESPGKPSSSEEDISAKKREFELKRSSLISRCSLIENELKRYGTIMDRGRCEFCGQDVADAHAFGDKMSERESELREAKLQSGRISESLTALEKQQRELSEYSYKVRLYVNNERELTEKRNRFSELRSEEERNEREISLSESELVQLRNELSQLEQLESLERQSKTEFNRLQIRKTEADRALTRIESQIENLTRDLGKLEKEIVEKRKMRERTAKLNATTSWFEKTFVPLMQVMEQTVMTTVQREFNSVFQSWFGMLMGNENLSVEADDRFAPIITQESYQTEYQNLSGGEKTAVALAYRLALNKAINTLIENIRTKDLIILDEPTDGFSSEQIDRIRDVLAELNLRQAILVSHESKIEAFVENVIRFHKEGHTSRVVAN